MTRYFNTYFQNLIFTFELSNQKPSYVFSKIQMKKLISLRSVVPNRQIRRPAEKFHHRQILFKGSEYDFCFLG